VVPAALVAEAAPPSPGAAAAQARPLKVIIAGAGIGGLVLAVALLKKGVDVVVFERDLTAIRGEGKYRGPIQVGGRLGLVVGGVVGADAAGCAGVAALWCREQCGSREAKALCSEGGWH
jgi:hypothetical protein